MCFRSSGRRCHWPWASRFEERSSEGCPASNASTSFSAPLPATATPCKLYSGIQLVNTGIGKFRSAGVPFASLSCQRMCGCQYLGARNTPRKFFVWFGLFSNWPAGPRAARSGLFRSTQLFHRTNGPARSAHGSGRDPVRRSGSARCAPGLFCGCCAMRCR